MAQQTKLRSFIEATLNIVIGSSVALLSQLILFPLFDIHVSFATDLWLTLWFTIISLIRSYTLRRIFSKGD